MQCCDYAGRCARSLSAGKEKKKKREWIGVGWIAVVDVGNYSNACAQRAEMKKERERERENGMSALQQQPSSNEFQVTRSPMRCVTLRYVMCYALP